MREHHMPSLLVRQMYGIRILHKESLLMLLLKFKRMRVKTWRLSHLLLLQILSLMTLLLQMKESLSKIIALDWHKYSKFRMENIRWWISILELGLMDQWVTGPFNVFMMKWTKFSWSGLEILILRSLLRLHSLT